MIKDDRPVSDPGGENRPGLGFKPINDSSNLGKLKVNEPLYRYPFQRGFVKGYKRVDFDVLVIVRGFDDLKKGHLCFRAIPSGIYKSDGGVISNDFHAQQASDFQSDTKSNAVLVGVGDPPEFPQCVIAAGIVVPSWVWLERAQDSVQLDRDITASTFSRKYTFKVSGTVTKGEMHVIKSGLAQSDGSAVDRLVKSVPEVVDDVVRQKPHLRSRFPDDFRTEDSLSGIRLSIYDQAIWVVFEERLKQQIEPIEVVVRPRQQETRAFK